MRRLFILFVVALVSGCAAPHIPTNYAGSDAGTIVVGIGAAADTSYSIYTLLVRPRAVATNDSTGVARLVWAQTNIFSKQAPEYENESEAGVVVVATLPAGEYEVFNFEVFQNPPARIFSSKVPFSMPFTVEAGRTAYLGNFQARNVRGRNLLGMPLNAGAVFAVSDRQATEMAIAQKKSPSVTADATDFTPNVTKLNSPFFVLP